MSVKIESPNTLKGKLQRGHGAGYLEALKLPADEVAPLLIDCICNDPRFDRQLESRCDYYASLINNMDIDIAPLAKHLKENDDTEDFGWKANLTIETLRALALRGSDDAAMILRDYISFGYWWKWAVFDLLKTQNADYTTSIPEILSQRFGGDYELYEKACSMDAEGFDVLFGTQSTIEMVMVKANLDDSEKEEQPEVKPNYTILSLDELFNICNKKNWYKISKVLESKVNNNDLPFLNGMLNSKEECRGKLAADAFGAIGTLESFEYLKKFLESYVEQDRNHICARVLHNIASFPKEMCLEIGRKWFNSDVYPIGVAGRKVLAEYAEIEDIPMLKKAILRSLENEDVYHYTLCSAVDALANFEDYGMFPEVEKAYNEGTTYSRLRAAETMLINAPNEFWFRYAYECLFDCQALTINIALECFDSVDKNDLVLVERLKEIYIYIAGSEDKEIIKDLLGDLVID